MPDIEMFSVTLFLFCVLFHLKFNVRHGSFQMESMQEILITCPLRLVTLSICYQLATPMTQISCHFSISAKSSPRFIAFITIFIS